MRRAISFFDYLGDPFTRSALLEQAVAHVRLTLVPIAIATVIGIISGVIAHRSRLLKPVILNTYSTFLTIPSFGLFALLIAVVGIGNTPAMIALTMYALLGITRNTVSGLESVDSAIVESAKGMGLSSRQRLLKIELPIAWPVIIAGLRVSTQIVIGVAAVAVLVGGSGLGEEIYQQGIRRIGSPGAINAIIGGTLTILVLAIIFDLAFQLRDRYPKELSGGQRQRVGVVRAMAADPPVMLMDEPFGAIDPITRNRLQNEFLRLQAEINKTIIFVTHDIDEAIKMGDRIAILQAQSHIAQFDTPEMILTEPANDFVKDFVGSGASLKRLNLSRVRDLDYVEDLPTGTVDEAVSVLRDRLQNSEWTSLLFTTDGRIAANDLTVLDDTENFLPLYNVSPVFTAEEYGQYGAALEELYAPVTEALTQEVMTELNARVSAENERPEAVAQAFLEENGLLGS